MSVLYLLRHGQAEPPGLHDEQRRLTDTGFQQVTRAAATLPKGELVLYHSPYVRTVESATVIERVAQTVARHSADWLTPDVPVVQTLAHLEHLSGQTAILVTHNPLVSLLAATLSGQPADEVSFRVGALARLEADDWLPGCMTFRWC